MKCPRCQHDVEDWHYYCPSCHTLVHEYNPEREKAIERAGLIERAGSRVLNVLLWTGVFGGLVLMARTIDWNDLWPQPKTPPVASVNRAVKEPASPSRKSSNAAAPKDAAGDVVAVSSTGRSAESVHDLKQKIEELTPPADEAAPLLLKTKPAPVSEAPAEATMASSAPAASPSAPMVSAGPPTRRAADRAELGVERIEKRTVDEAGYVALDSYAPARIYVDGQFSGTTPRTIKLLPGDHQIKLLADGFEEWTRRVRLKKSQQVGIKASMKKKLSQ